MKNFVKHAFSLAACALGGTGTTLGAAWTFAEAIGFPNGIVHESELLKATTATVLSAGILAAGYFRREDFNSAPKQNGPA